jgi:Zn-finger nucleic acid-binding protein
MKCPICSVELQMMERQNIEIDYCPQCRGVWLDRGELDKLIERSNQLSSGPERREYEHEHERDDHDRHASSYGRKKQSFLSGIFESFGGEE